MRACSMVSSSPTTKVPGPSSKLERQWMRTPWLRAYSTERSCSTFAPEAAISSISSNETTAACARPGRSAGRRCRRRRRRCRSRRRRRRRRRPARRRSCPSRRGRASSRRGFVETPWKPATSTIMSSSSAAAMRSALTSRMRAFVCEVSVTMPACEPVSEIARWPRSLIAIAHSAHEMRSPVDSSMSISRGSGVGGDLVGRGDQLVGRLPARGQHRDDAVALLARGDDPPGGALEALGVGDGRPAELHHDRSGHGCTG